MKKVVYLDTSIIVAIALKEPGYQNFVEDLSRYNTFVSSNLFESELISTFKREKISIDAADDYLEKINLLYPTESFSKYIKEVLAISHVRGADLFHLATALWFSGQKRKELIFATLDEKQGAVSRRLGFIVL